ncbi:HNH endonuclease, partial [Staphylococcus aureus]
HVDHIHPVSKGGENDILNYITACAECNGGKSDRLLSDDSVMAKQRAQLEELNQRREQLEQMLAWREGMRDIDDVAF